MSSTTQLRSQLGNLSKTVGPYNPTIVELRRELAEATLTKRIQEIVEKAPPLRPEQIERLSALLAGANHAPTT